ncbi:MAG: response regulator transcription factor [Anaerolineales bacterium]|nr:response regulator transcription factor [Anaerolineales bacterium]
MGTKLLLVDDDPTLLSFLSEYLQNNDFTVLTAGTGVDALRMVYKERPDLVVLDVMMPGMDGWELTARLRELADFPIILLTAKSSEGDKLRGFKLGVDDYVTKPFSFAELTARVQAVLARSQANQSAASPMYAAGNLSVDMDKRQVMRGAESIPLTPTEFRLLQCLIQKRGHPITEAALAQEVWGTYRQSDTAVVRRYIWLLRQKLEDDPSHPTRILTVRGFGYRMGTAPLSPPPPSKDSASG